MKYRMKPIYADAMKFDGDNAEEIGRWMVDIDRGRTTFEVRLLDGFDVEVLRIDTLDGTLLATPGNWIVRDPRGFSICSPRVFAAISELVE
jgi:hypothetical protein